jgi:cellulose synthase/poly-beta-1,6-N-acetylglucosamine synthase-like glycosyltransferase
MSGLTYSGVGLVVLTATGLAVKGMHKILAGKPGRRPLSQATDSGRLGTLGSGRVSVAVVVPAHNEAATIEQTVRSCLHQTYPVAQMIVVADNCTDPTAVLARVIRQRINARRHGMTPSSALPPQVVDQIVTRASRPDFDRWADQVTRCGHCAHPVRYAAGSNTALTAAGG